MKYIKTGLLSTPNASLFQVKQELAFFGNTTREMFKQVTESYDMKPGDFEDAYDKFEKEEDESDNIEVEIADYLTLVSESRLATDSSKRVRAMFKIVSEIESIADSALNMAKAFKRRNEQGIVLPEECEKNLKHLYGLVDSALQIMCSNLSEDYANVNVKKAYELENQINECRNTLKREHIRAIEEKRYDYPTGVLYSDMFSECEKAGDYIINVTEAIYDINEE